MNTKALVLLILLYCCVSCDISTPFEIDGEKEFVLENKCGTIIIKGSLFHPRVLFGCRFQGEYFVNTDLLRIEPTSKQDTITNLMFRFNKEDLTTNEINTKVGDALSISFNLQTKVPYQPPGNSILILPSGFITCNGNPLITDTIRIQLKK